MKKLLLLLVVLGIASAMPAAVLADGASLPHTGRVVFVISGDVEVAAHEQADAVIVLDGDARVAGTVNTLVVAGGTAIATGATLETAVIVNGTLELTEGTAVLKDVVTVGSTVEAADGVEIGGNITDVAGGLAGFGIFIGAAMIAIWLGIGLATLLFALFLVGIAGRQVRSATDLIGNEPVRTALVGLLAVVVTPLLAALAIATVIGIPAGIGLLLFAWPTLALVGYVIAAIWIGQWLLGRREEAPTPDRPYAAAILGLVVSFVLGFVPLFTAVISIFGVGAVVLAGWRTLRRSEVGGPAVATQPAPAS